MVALNIKGGKLIIWKWDFQSSDKLEYSLQRVEPMTSLGIKFWFLNVQSLEKFNHQKSFAQLHTLAGKDDVGFFEIFRMVLNQKQQQLVWAMFKLLLTPFIKI